MEQRISPSDEKQLTRAIEKAATLATANDSLDRDQLLANSLKQEGVDKRFAKVASAAFNKRITVLTFKKTADEHRAEPFALTDDSKVFELMGGEPAQQKTASATVAPFSISMETSAPMQKCAAKKEIKLRENYEDRVDYQLFNQHIEAMVDKQAAAVSKLNGDIASLENLVNREADDVAAYFNKTACSSFEFTTAVNLYGNALKKALGDRVSSDVSFAKTASAVIAPNKTIFKKVAALIQDSKHLDDLRFAVADYEKGLAEFCKTAADTGDFIASCEFHGLTKDAAMYTPFVTAALSNGMRSAMAAGSDMSDQVHRLRQTIQDNISTNFANARNMYNAGNSASMAPGDVLDAEFLTKDRYRDRLLGWSDMAADPQFAMYPAEQVFYATNKMMDTDSSLERPDRREVLRAHVAQLLAQNNRQSTADIAALANTAKTLNETGGGAVERAAEAVKDMDKVEAPEPIEFAGLFSGDKEISLKDRLKDADAANRKQWDAAAAADEEDIKREEDKAQKDKENTEKTRLKRAEIAARLVQARSANRLGAAMNKSYRQYLAAVLADSRKGKRTFIAAPPQLIAGQGRKGSKSKTQNAQGTQGAQPTP